MKRTMVVFFIPGGRHSVGRMVISKFDSPWSSERESKTTWSWNLDWNQIVHFFYFHWYPFWKRYLGNNSAIAFLKVETFFSMSVFVSVARDTPLCDFRVIFIIPFYNSLVFSWLFHRQCAFFISTSKFWLVLLIFWIFQA